MKAYRGPPTTLGSAAAVRSQVPFKCKTSLASPKEANRRVSLLAENRSRRGTGFLASVPPGRAKEAG